MARLGREQFLNEYRISVRVSKAVLGGMVIFHCGECNSDVIPIIRRTPASDTRRLGPGKRTITTAKDLYIQINRQA